ncbi:MAG TPA: Hpt domain-containing protein, partial [Polyangiales bacterium]|nr:Hpt domain-containing protein [Polyangiales bacterium]
MTRGPGKKGPDTALLALFATEIATHMQPLGAWLKRGFVHDGEGVPAELLRALHSINGAARVMDAQGLAELAGSVESCLKQWATLTPQQAQVIFVQAADVHAYLQRLASAPAPADFLELSA